MPFIPPGIWIQPTVANTLCLILIWGFPALLLCPHLFLFSIKGIVPTFSCPQPEVCTHLDYCLAGKKLKNWNLLRFLGLQWVGSTPYFVKGA